jgi:predicted neuraminidase
MNQKGLCRNQILLSLSVAVMGVLCPSPLRAEPLFEGQLIEPLNDKHNHGSCVVEIPGGDVLVSWYKGSGERTADDVRIVGSRLAQGGDSFSSVETWADTEGFPDCNSVMLIDAEEKLWLFWPLIVANQWETAILMSRYSTDYSGQGGPNWDWQAPIILKPGDRFGEEVTAALEAMKATLPQDLLDRYGDAMEELKEKANDKYARRAGWMPRASPILLSSGRMILPLYSDGYSFSLIAVSDDNGKTWQSSNPIISMGGVQPSVVQKKDGTLVAFMRDNGPPPQRVIVSTSKDEGLTWTPGVDHDTLLEEGAGVEALNLGNGHWILVHNNTENGRHQLAVSYTTDEGGTWKTARYLEKEEKDQGSFSYPSLHLGKDGIIHGSYTYKKKSDGEGETIKYVRFNEDWVREGLKE